MNTQKYWDDKWKLHEQEYIRDHNPMYSVVRPYMKGNVVDIGCGNGYIGRDIGSRYSGIDFSTVAIQKARDYNSEADLICGDALNTPWGDREFDTVICLTVVEHFLNYWPLLWECQRLCRGHMVFVLPWNGRGPEHYHPHWPAYKAIDVFSKLGEVIDYRHISHKSGKWVFVVVEII